MLQRRDAVQRVVCYRLSLLLPGVLVERGDSRNRGLLDRTDITNNPRIWNPNALHKIRRKRSRRSRARESSRPAGSRLFDALHVSIPEPREARSVARTPGTGFTGLLSAPISRFPEAQTCSAPVSAGGSWPRVPEARFARCQSKICDEISDPAPPCEHRRSS